MERKSAQYGCPMCGCNDETRGEVYIDAGYMCVDYICNRCGLHYLGQVSWNANRDPIKDEDMR